ncbi:hypothetical protein EDB19DRAFT_1750306 [Suillus lakei]|nr:hypothetical protein EDB19DRAFT_1750306 [Suillus lakei]
MISTDFLICGIFFLHDVFQALRSPADDAFDSCLANSTYYNFFFGAVLNTVCTSSKFRKQCTIANRRGLGSVRRFRTASK